MVAFLILLVPLALFFRGATRLAAIIAIAIIIANTPGLSAHSPLMATECGALAGQIIEHSRSALHCLDHQATVSCAPR